MALASPANRRFRGPRSGEFPLDVPPGKRWGASKEPARRPVRNRDSNPFDFPSGRRYSYAQFDDEESELREYEIVYVIRPDLSDEDRSTKVERIHSLITENGGELGKVEDWGKRVLAYEIKHNSEGYYGLAEFRLPPSSVKTVEDRLNIDEEILRYQIISRS
jgi:small subunit ribosomal protein S6